MELGTLELKGVVPIIDYSLDEKMQRVRAVQLDLLDKFAQTCERNGLRYFLDGGTLLGAVRHKGFIPWDDDVDVIMPRKDYDELCKIAEKEFEYPYFFQTAMTEESFFRAHAQLRNSSTTGFIPQDKDKSINKGIFLDVFILDGIAGSLLARIYQRIELTLFMKILSYVSDRPYEMLGFPKKVIYSLVHFSYKIVPYKKQFSFFNEKVISRYSKRNTRLLGDLTLGWRNNVHWPKEWFDDYIVIPFENLKLRAPIQYDKVLNKQYGEYMRIPNESEFTNHCMHEHIEYDPDTPYMVYESRREDKCILI